MAYISIDVGRLKFTIHFWEINKRIENEKEIYTLYASAYVRTVIEIPPCC